jgi:hypothetical protein
MGSTSEHFTIDGWSTTNGYQGGAASFGKYTFLSDMNAGTGTPSEFVRFDNIDHTFVRMSIGDISDVSIGLDGRLYTLSAVDDKRVRGYDPITLQLLSDVLLGSTESAIAVGQDGTIFAARRDTATNGYIDKFSPNGSLLRTLPAATFGGLTDIDLSLDGSEVMFTTAKGKIGYTNQSLASITGQFVVTTGDLDDTFAAYVPIPEPSSFMLTTALVAFFLKRQRGAGAENR